jgi:predicted acetyltransferase
VIQLRELTIKDEGALNYAIREFIDPNFSFVFGYRIGEDSFHEYIAKLRLEKNAETVSSGFVPNSMLFGFLGDEIVGRVSLRHCLNKNLEEVGGHIGFGVVPRFRQFGYASNMLTKTLPLAKGLGLKRALVTCDEENLASRKTIERCGGVFERFAHTADGSIKRRYWINL